MDYQTLRATVLDILNRNDATNDDADKALAWGVRRVERLLRTPLQKALTTGTATSGQTNVDIPADYLGMEWVKVNDAIVYRQTHYQEDPDDINGEPEYWFLQGTKIEFQPPLREGDTYEICYWNEMVKYPNDTDITNYSLVLPDVITYAALTSPAIADKFSDLRAQQWESKLGTLVEEVQLMSDIELMQGGLRMGHPYEGIA